MEEETAIADGHDDWTAVAKAFRFRLMELGLFGNKAELARRSQVSDATWRKLLDGLPVTRLDRRALMAKTAEWPPDAIDRILAGEDPNSFGPSTRIVTLDFDSYLERLTAVEERLDLLEERFDDRAETEFHGTLRKLATETDTEPVVRRAAHGSTVNPQCGRYRRCCQQAIGGRNRTTDVKLVGPSAYGQPGGGNPMEPVARPPGTPTFAAGLGPARWR
jgi:hypothetical protein